ncbi:MAG: hypothetical protein FJX76_05950 [Armatimonadetes bacterium]|nr:hypothetical protein [Armatimonadota bacterium]
MRFPEGPTPPSANLFKVSAPVFVMEDHCDAYPAWKGLAFQEAVCVHLDAHLDLSDEGFPRETVEGILACKTADDLHRFRSNPRLPWGGFHAGNYLYPAVLDDTVRTLYWVVPPWLPQGRDLLAWTRDELQKWYDVTLDDYASLRTVDGRVEGRLLGRPFTLCTVDRLPTLGGPVLLDIDVDYFLDADDTIFEAPDRILEILQRKALVPESITVSYSVNGGYLPLEHRYVGDLVVALTRGEATEDSLRAARRIIAADRLRARGASSEALAEYFAAMGAGYFLPSLHFKISRALLDEGRFDEATRHAGEAAALDAHYRPRALDVAFVHFRRKNHAATLEWLRRACDEDSLDAPLARYIEGLSHMRAGDYPSAIALWQGLVDEPTFRASEQAYLRVVLGRALYREGRSGEALTHLRKAAQMEPHNALYQQHLGDALGHEGLLDEAARHLRKAISLDDRRLSVLDAHRMLAEVYDAGGKRLMADAERRRLITKDVLGTASLESMVKRK